jgi:hypothetical protein
MMGAMPSRWPGSAAEFARKIRECEPLTEHERAQAAAFIEAAPARLSADALRERNKLLRSYHRQFCGDVSVRAGIVRLLTDLSRFEDGEYRHFRHCVEVPASLRRLCLWISLGRSPLVIRKDDFGPLFLVLSAGRGKWATD